MAFIANDFSPVGANARRGVCPQIFAYTSPDTLAAVKTSGYFDSIAKLLEKDDWIITNTSTGSTTVFTVIFILAITAAGVVTVVTVDISAA